MHECMSMSPSELMRASREPYREDAGPADDDSEGGQRAKEDISDFGAPLW